MHENGLSVFACVCDPKEAKSHVRLACVLAKKQNAVEIIMGTCRLHPQELSRSTFQAISGGDLGWQFESVSVSITLAAQQQQN